jgi:hypothetical protein
MEDVGGIARRNEHDELTVPHEHARGGVVCCCGQSENKRALRAQARESNIDLRCKQIARHTSHVTRHTSHVERHL